jgi:hypothetical protein
LYTLSPSAWKTACGNWKGYNVIRRRAAKLRGGATAVPENRLAKLMTLTRLFKFAPDDSGFQFDLNGNSVGGVLQVYIDKMNYTATVGPPGVSYSARTDLSPITPFTVPPKVGPNNCTAGLLKYRKINDSCWA